MMPFTPVVPPDEPVRSQSSPIYSYAIYENLMLKSSSSKYPFQITPGPGTAGKNLLRRYTEDFDELWYRDNNNKVVVVVKKIRYPY